MRVSDNGRGVPIDKHPKHKKSALELILTTLHAGGKFGHDNYIHSGGLHGVGASVVNALSTKCTVEVERDGFHWVQEYREGKAVGGLKQLGPSDRNGTRTCFWADRSIFDDVNFQFEILAQRLRELAFLNREH